MGEKTNPKYGFCHKPNPKLYFSLKFVQTSPSTHFFCLESTKIISSSDVELSHLFLVSSEVQQGAFSSVVRWVSYISPFYMFEITKILAVIEIVTLSILKEESQTVAQKLTIDVREKKNTK